jgi:hypothetical protein
MLRNDTPLGGKILWASSCHRAFTIKILRFIVGRSKSLSIKKLDIISYLLLLKKIPVIYFVNTRQVDHSGSAV